MFKKKTGVKIMAVVLAATIAMPSVGVALAAGRESNPLHGLYAEGEGGSVSENSGSATATSTDTTTRPGEGEQAVELEVAVKNSSIAYGDDVRGNITVTASPSREGAGLSDFGEKDYVLKYYKYDGDQPKELQERPKEMPKDVGKYGVQAYSTEASQYKSAGSGIVDFEIAQKEITIKPKDQTMEANASLPEKWEAELVGVDKLPYDEKLVENYAVACDVKDQEGTVTDISKPGVYDLVIKDSAKLELVNANADNYTVKAENGKLTVGKKLDLQIEENKKFTYGEFDESKFEVTAEYEEKAVELTKSRLSFQYFDDDGKKLTGAKTAGTYKVVVAYNYDEADQYWGESDSKAFEITTRPITVNVEDFEIENGAKLPGEEDLKKHLTITGLVKKVDGKEGLPYDDKWETEPTAKFKDEKIDTTIAEGYEVIAVAKLKTDCEANYDLKVNDPKNGTMTVKVAEGEEKKELKLQLEDVSVVYGEGSSKEDRAANVRDAVIAKIKATEADGDKEVSLQKEDIVLGYFDAEEKALEKAPVDAGSYLVKAKYKGDGAYKESEETDFAKLVITERTITIEAESYQILNGAELPTPTLKAYERLSYDDKWADGDEQKEDAPKADEQKDEEQKDDKPRAGEPKAAYEKEIDTKAGGVYNIIVSAEVEKDRAKNYKLDLKNGTLTIAKAGEHGKSLYEFELKEGTATEKAYDGKPFDLITKDSIISKNNFKYDGEFEQIWSSNGTVLESAPKDAGNYKLTVRIPEADAVWEGSEDFEIKITQRPVNVKAVVESEKNETFAGEPLKCVVVKDALVEGDQWVKEPVLKTVGDVNKKDSTYTVRAADGDAGENYQIAYGEAITIKVLDERKPLVDLISIKKPKNGYIYTGDQICPTVTAKSGSTKLKLNVDYVVEYSNNVNAGTAAVTVRGIGGYAGYQTTTFDIGKKDIKSVTLSEVGAVIMSDHLEEDLKKTLVVMDGNIEVSPDDYDIRVAEKKNGSFDSVSKITCGDSEVLDRVLKVEAKGNNYTGTSKKTAKLVILGKGSNAKSITGVTFEPKLSSKGYTYNGKAQKPKVKVIGAKSSEYKVVYSKNVNAGTAEIRIVGVYNSKKKSGCCGVSEPKTFTINQKDFSKVKASAGTAVPKNAGPDDIKLTVKDGSHVLTKDVDYKITGLESIFDGNKVKDSIKAGSKQQVTIVSTGGNYKTNSSKTVTLKFGQLDLKAKKAIVKVTMTGSNASDVTVVYNGVELKQGTDYTAKVKQGKNGMYTVTIKAAGGKTGIYKGSRTVKNVEIKKTAEQ